MLNKPIVFDSFALLALFHKERGWRKVRDVLKGLESQDEKGLLCRINWGEFYYIIRRRLGKTKAEESIALLEQLPVKIVSIDDELVKEASEIKSEYPVAYADAFCIALTKRVSGYVLTGDPEFSSVKDLIDIEWL